MDLLLAIQKYVEKLMEHGYYPKAKKPSLGKLEKMADLCMAGKHRKLSRYVPSDADEALKKEFDEMMERIKEICNNEKKNS